MNIYGIGGAARVRGSIGHDLVLAGDRYRFELERAQVSERSNEYPRGYFKRALNLCVARAQGKVFACPLTVNTGTPIQPLITVGNQMSDRRSKLASYQLRQ